MQDAIVDTSPTKPSLVYSVHDKNYVYPFRCRKVSAVASFG